MTAGPVSITSLGLGLGAVGALFALHHLRTRPTRRAVATLIFWQQSRREQAARRLWSRRFSHPWTFLLLALIALLIAASLSADRWGRGDGGRAVIVIDVGSHTACPGVGGASLLLGAVSDVKRDTSRLTSSPTLIAAGARPSVLCDQSVPLPVFDDRLDRLEPLAEPSNAAPALELAASMIGSRTGTIDWYTDSPALPEGLPAGVAERVRLRRRAAPVEAAAIVGAVYDPAGGGAAGGTLRVRLAGRSGKPLKLTAAFGGGVREQRIERLDGSAEADFDEVAADGQRLTLQLTDAPGSPGEHTVQCQLPQRSQPRFCVVGEIQRPLREALASVGTIVTSPAGAIVVARQGQALPAGGAGTISIVDPRPADAAVTAAVPAAVPPAVPPAGLITAATPAGVTLADLDFEGATASGRSAIPPAAQRLLVAGDQTSAAIDRTPDGPTLYLSSALVDETADLPRRAAFPVLIDRLTGELIGRRAAPLAVSARRVAQDPLWPDPAALLLATNVVHDAPLTSSAEPAASPAGPPPEFAAHYDWPWVTILTAVALIMLLVQSLFVAAKKII